MAKRSGKNQKTQTKAREFVVAVFVQDSDQARECEILLQNNDIPVVIKEQNQQPAKSGKPVESAGNDGFAVMVPEDYLDEALVCIESQGAYDDFYDFALEDEQDEDNADYDDDLLDDNF